MFLFLIGGVFFGIIVITGGWEGITILLDLILPQLAGFAFIYLVVMILVIRLKWGQKRWVIFTLILGLLGFTFNILPLTGMPAAVESAEGQFNSIFGENWIEKIDLAQQAKFRTTQYSLWDYYRGIPPAICNVSYDLEYAVKFGNDSLRFDVYSPFEGTGPFPAVLVLHGGGWFLGKKGMGDLTPMNRHIASLGYVVFDIEYGLADISSFPTLPSFTRGIEYNNSYSIPQMIENIGAFTHFLAKNAAIFNVNLSAVFILGKSAGAHLAGCVGLGYNNSPYSALFNQSLSIRGVILYFPPTNMTIMEQNSLKIAQFYKWFINIQDLFDVILEGNSSNYAIYSPISHVDLNSPPVLLFHGKKDKLVPYDESVRLQLAMQDAGRPAILIGMPFCGHGYEMFSSNPYGQITYYYLERFLALTTALNI